MSAEQPTIIATSIGLQRSEGRLVPGPVYRYAAELARAGRHPRMCIIPTAMGDDPAVVSLFYSGFSQLDMLVSHLALFPMPTVADMREHLLRQDVIWVGGGSTANLLAVWRVHGLDAILRECWEAGVVLMGVSAGSLCWHLGGTTDSFGPTLQAVTNALGFLPYSNSPHYDSEPQRRPLTQQLIADGVLPDGYATDDGTGLVFFGQELHEAVTEEPGKSAYSVSRGPDGTAVETTVPTREL
jgi:peptidase E